jgi:hypothetical protein
MHVVVELSATLQRESEDLLEEVAGCFLVVMSPRAAPLGQQQSDGEKLST